MARGRSPINVQKFLRGADYPASRDDLYDLAENNGADDEILAVMRKLPDVDFESPTDVQEAVSDTQSAPMRQEAGRKQQRDGDGEEEAPRSRRPQIMDEEEEEAPTSRRSQDGDEDPRSQSRRGQDDNQDDELEMHRRHYEERKRLRTAAQQKDDEEWDHRLKGHETQKLADARHMRNVPEGETDGRGAVRNPKTDRRLKQNETQALHDARAMKHVGENETDGRGRVTKFGPGERDERINREDEQKKPSREEPDPETGAFSRRRKDDEGHPTEEAQTAEERHKRMTYRQHKNRR